ncbi:MAG: hypothetical protein JWO54_441 [Candidatus Saccharibacteria bacterium]|nr:hypothetical protein [Candidatus Saccharibacteria bacterium]MDB5180681.1 hypothetical protein [Candidatus Saccharibacteria bacterium]
MNTPLRVTTQAAITTILPSKRRLGLQQSVLASLSAGSLCGEVLWAIFAVMDVVSSSEGWNFFPWYLHLVVLIWFGISYSMSTWLLISVNAMYEYFYPASNAPGEYVDLSPKITQ